MGVSFAGAGDINDVKLFISHYQGGTERDSAGVETAVKRISQ